MYYYLITLDKEFNHYFKRKFTLATLLYITNRYIPLVYNVYNSPWDPFSSQEVPPVWCLAALPLTSFHRKCIYMFVQWSGMSIDL